MLYLLLILTVLCCRTNALVTVLCNETENCVNGFCLYLQAGCVLYDNGELKLAKYNNYGITYHSGGFDDNGYHVEYYFGEDWRAAISTPNGNSGTYPSAASSPGNLYFAFRDKSVEEAANDARNACRVLTSKFVTIALPCDDVYNAALREYKPN